MATRSRRASTEAVTEPPYQDKDVRQRQYTMNTRRALDKKMAATKRPPFEYEHKSGGTYMKFNAAAYESYKSSVLSHYKTDIDQGNVILTRSKEQLGLETDIILTKLHQGHTQFTHTLYNTQCTALVNGKNRFHFWENDLKEIINTMAPADKIDNANKALERALSDMLHSTQTQQQKTNGKKKKGRPTKNTAVRVITDQTATIKILSPDPIQRSAASKILELEDQPNCDIQTHDDETTECSICDENVSKDDEALECSGCVNWIHVRCDTDITPEIYKMHDEDPTLPYFCAICKEGRPNAQKKHRAKNPTNSSVTISPTVETRTPTCMLPTMPPRSTTFARSTNQENATVTASGITLTDLTGSETTAATTCTVTSTNTTELTDITILTVALPPAPTTYTSTVDMTGATTLTADTILTTASTSHNATMPMTTTVPTGATTLTTATTLARTTVPVSAILSVDDTSRKEKEIVNEKKELNKLSRNLKTWQKNLQKESLQQDDAVKKLSTARVHIETLEYRVNELEHSLSLRRQKENNIPEMQRQAPFPPSDNENGRPPTHNPPSGSGLPQAHNPHGTQKRLAHSPFSMGEASREPMQHRMSPPNDNRFRQQNDTPSMHPLLSSTVENMEKMQMQNAVMNEKMETMKMQNALILEKMEKMQLQLQLDNLARQMPKPNNIEQNIHEFHQMPPVPNNIGGTNLPPILPYDNPTAYERNHNMWIHVPPYPPPRYGTQWTDPRIGSPIFYTNYNQNIPQWQYRPTRTQWQHTRPERTWIPQNHHRSKVQSQSKHATLIQMHTETKGATSSSQLTPTVAPLLSSALNLGQIQQTSATKHEQIQQTTAPAERSQQPDESPSLTPTQIQHQDQKATSVLTAIQPSALNLVQDLPSPIENQPKQSTKLPEDAQATKPPTLSFLEKTSLHPPST